MNTNTWEHHLQTRGNPLVEGTWGKTPWSFYTYGQVIPPELPLRTSMCVPVCTMDGPDPQIMLTLNMKRGGYEIPGGHLDLDPRKSGQLESAAATAVREMAEETGLRVKANKLIPYGYIEARNASSRARPVVTYMQFFGAFTPERPGPITDPKVDGAGIFTLDALRRMAGHGAMQTTELRLVCLGARAVLRQHGMSSGHIRLP